MTTFEFARDEIPGRVVFGAGSRRRVAEEADRAGAGAHPRDRLHRRGVAGRRAVAGARRPGGRALLRRGAARADREGAGCPGDGARHRRRHGVDRRWRVGHRARQGDRPRGRRHPDRGADDVCRVGDDDDLGSHRRRPQDDRQGRPGQAGRGDLRPRTDPQPPALDRRAVGHERTRALRRGALRSRGRSGHVGARARGRPGDRHEPAPGVQHPRRPRRRGRARCSARISPACRWPRVAPRCTTRRATCSAACSTSTTAR